MNKLSCTSIVAPALIAAALIVVPTAQAQDCEDRVTGGGFIIIADTPTTISANFGAGGGLLQGELWGYLNYVDRDPASAVRHVRAQDVVAYCLACTNVAPGIQCRRITYSPAIVDGVEVDAVIVQVCDGGEPGVPDTFSICIPSVGYCVGGVLGGDGKPSGGNIQLHAPDPGCTSTIPVCTDITTLCPCFVCPIP